MVVAASDPHSRLETTGKCDVACECLGIEEQLSSSSPG